MTDIRTNTRRQKMAFLTADGCQDVFHQIELSGEPLLPELAHELKKGKPMELLEYQDLTLQGLDYECQYSDYWNASGGNDGQIVDAIIMPVAPHAGVISGQFYHAGQLFPRRQILGSF